MLKLIHDILVLYTTPGLIFAFGLCFLLIKIPLRDGLAGYRMARKMMGYSYIVFFLSLLGEAVSLSLDTSTLLQHIIMISIGLFQAFLFTYALTTLIDVNFFTWRRFIREAFVVVTPVCASLVLYFLCPERYVFIVFLILSVFYFLKLLEYVFRFMHRYRDYERRMSNYFSDDERQRLQWVMRFFFEALAIGLFALLYSFYTIEITSIIFTVIMVFYYIVFCIRFINYAYSFHQIETAITEDLSYMKNTIDKLSDASKLHGKTKTASDSEIQLMSHLDSLMIEKKIYSNPYLTIEDIAVKADVPYRMVSATINRCKGMTFKSWVNTYRVDEAIHLIEDGYLKYHTIEALSQIVGFTNRINFYRVFKNITGHPPTEYYL